MKIENSIVLVTGANRGIGRELLAALLNKGARRVYAATRTPEGSAELSSLDRRVEVLPIDITDPQLVRAAATRAHDVTLVVNNAGVLASGSILAGPVEDLRRDVEVNYFGAVHMMRAFAPVIAANGGGTIVNILTIVALASMPGIGGYCASKAAAYSLTQAMRAELLGQGIRVLAVFPGPVDTDMLRGFDMPKTPPAVVARAVLAGIESDTEDILPDPVALDVHAAWLKNPKVVERRFGAQ